MQHRLVNAQDFGSIYSLYMDAYSNAFLTYDMMEEEDFYKIYLPLVQTKTVYAVEDNHHIVATYRLVPKTDRQAHILYLGSFAVVKDMQGQGSGSMILQQIKTEAVINNKFRIELSVNIDNAPAIRVYQKNGFVVEGKLRNNYRLSSTGKYYDEYLMAWIYEAIE